MPEETPTPKKDEWFKDFLHYGSSTWFGGLPIIAVIAILASVLLPGLAKLKSRLDNPLVVIYTSQDEVYAEPILKDFEKKTGIEVRAVYDTEAVKTVGLANRLLAEREHPQCDVFWNNEELRTRQLAARDVFRETNGWTTVGSRSRRIVINTNKVSLADAPRSLVEITNVQWRGRIALAYPLFGTTATHFLALRQHWGDEDWRTWCRALQDNRPFLVDGNSVVVKLVGSGEAWLGLTDSDDIAAESREGAPVASLPLTDESLLIANTVAITRNAPHPEAARQLFEYLRQPGVANSLVEHGALERACADETTIKTLRPDWQRIIQEMDSASATLKQIFLR